MNLSTGADKNRCSWLMLLCFLSCSLVSFPQPKATINGDFPDPTTIFANGKYYTIGTSSEWGPHFPIYTSDDLRNWTQTGFVFSSAPEWTQSSFWAPEYFYNEGIYYVYYSAKRKSDGVSCIGVATSKYPDRDFVDHGVVVDYGTESIDAYVVKEGNQLYMTWKAYGLDKRPIELIASKLSADGFRLEGEPFSLLQDTARVGIEGQAFVKKDGYYYMFYSAGACCGVGCDYNVQAVRSKTIQGPYERVGAQVLLGENEDWKCMGHGTFVDGKDGKLYYLFHGYSKIGTTYTGREGLLAELQWSPSGEPSFVFVPSTQLNKGQDVQFDLSKKSKTKPFLQWDFRYSKPKYSYTANGLQLEGTTASDNPTGIAMTLRPTSKVYEVGTSIDLSKSSKTAQKGVVIYGDKDRSIGLSVLDNNIQFWLVKDGKKMLIKEQAIATGLKKLEIKLELAADLQVRAYYKESSSDWVEVVPADAKLASINGISPWDRSPRPGIHFEGKEMDKAVFQSLYLINKS
ncbi:glycoside hydrolase family 43 protein [Sphingobacterium hungaricum]